MSSHWTLYVASSCTEERAVVGSVLRIVKGLTADNWTIVEAAQANLSLVRGLNGDSVGGGGADLRLTARFLESGESDPRDGALFVSRPLRPAQFLLMLDNAGRRLAALRAASIPAPARAATPIVIGAADDNAPVSTSTNTTVDAAMGLHNLRQARGAALLIAADGSELAAVSMQRGAVASRWPLAELMHRLQHVYGSTRAIHDRQLPEPSAATHMVSLDQLCWQLGEALSQRMGLAPWLSKERAYQLVAWPDFGAIGTDASAFKLAAVLSRQALTPPELADTCGMDFSIVARFLNSAAACGLLRGSTPVFARAASSSAAKPSSLFSRLRRKLGIS